MVVHVRNIKIRLLTSGTMISWDKENNAQHQSWTEKYKWSSHHLETTPIGHQEVLSLKISSTWETIKNVLKDYLQEIQTCQRQVHSSSGEQKGKEVILNRIRMLNNWSQIPSLLLWQLIESSREKEQDQHWTQLQSIWRQTIQSWSNCSRTKK